MIALGRVLLRRALRLEAESPSYVFVDVCRLAAKESAAKVAKTWEISVAGLSVRNFAGFSSDGARRPSVVLVNHFLYEDVQAAASEMSGRVFPVTMRVAERLRRRILKLPTNARVLLVLEDDPFHAGRVAAIRPVAPEPGRLGADDPPAQTECAGRSDGGRTGPALHRLSFSAQACDDVPVLRWVDLVPVEAIEEQNAQLGIGGAGVGVAKV